MVFDCKVFQYDDKAERWQLRATYADPIAAHVDGDGIAIHASDFDGPALRAINSDRAAEVATTNAMDAKKIAPDFNAENGAWIRVLVTDHEGVQRGYEVALSIVVDGAAMLDSNATAQLADPLRRNT